MKSTVLLLVTILFAFQINAQDLELVTPEQVGMDSKKLSQADKVIEKAIENKEIPGAVLAVVKDGRMAYLKSYGNKQIYSHGTISIMVKEIS